MRAGSFRTGRRQLRSAPARSSSRPAAVSLAATMATSWSGRGLGKGWPGSRKARSSRTPVGVVRKSSGAFIIRSPGATKASSRGPPAAGPRRRNTRASDSASACNAAASAARKDSAWASERVHQPGRPARRVGRHRADASQQGGQRLAAIGTGRKLRGPEHVRGVEVCVEARQWGRSLAGWRSVPGDLTGAEDRSLRPWSSNDRAGKGKSRAPISETNCLGLRLLARVRSERGFRGWVSRAYRRPPSIGANGMMSRPRSRHDGRRSGLQRSQGISHGCTVGPTGKVIQALASFRAVATTPAPAAMVAALYRDLLPSSGIVSTLGAAVQGTLAAVTDACRMIRSSARVDGAGVDLHPGSTHDPARSADEGHWRHVLAALQPGRPPVPFDGCRGG